MSLAMLIVIAGAVIVGLFAVLIAVALLLVHRQLEPREE